MYEEHKKGSKQCGWMPNKQNQDHFYLNVYSFLPSHDYLIKQTFA